jgi:PAS domain S-box-containing protein
VVYSNPAMRSTTGYDESALAESTFWESFIPADCQPAFMGMVQQTLQGQPGRTELRYRARDESVRIAYALAQPASSAGITLLMVDITRERRLEQDLQRAQRLEMVGRLSSGIAHDFNNLLLVIMGLNDLVRSSLPPDHVVQKDLQKINEASDQAAQLAGQLLAFGRNRRSARAASSDVGRVARRTLEMLRPTLPSQIDLETQLSDDRLAVPADETQLQQILMNLCLNARDALAAKPKGEREPDQGRILVRIESVCHPGENGTSNGRWARMVVEDNGPGMTEQVRSRIFEPFFSTKDHGTGLGLAVVQQIVEGCGGRVEVTSRPGAGARFEVWLPLLAE